MRLPAIDYRALVGVARACGIDCEQAVEDLAAEVLARADGAVKAHHRGRMVARMVLRAADRGEAVEVTSPGQGAVNRHGVPLLGPPSRRDRPQGERR